MNRYYLILIIAGGVALFFLLRSYQFKLKASQQRDSLRVEEAARLEAERELMQERLNQLEKELLAGTLHVEEKKRRRTDERRVVKEVVSTGRSRCSREHKNKKKRKKRKYKIKKNR